MLKDQLLIIQTVQSLQLYELMKDVGITITSLLTPHWMKLRV